MCPFATSLAPWFVGLWDNLKEQIRTMPFAKKVETVPPLCPERSSPTIPVLFHINNSSSGGKGGQDFSTQLTQPGSTQLTQPQRTVLTPVAETSAADLGRDHCHAGNSSDTKRSQQCLDSQRRTYNNGYNISATDI